MPLSTLAIGLIIFATFVSAVISGIMSMGGGVLLLSVLSFFLPASTALVPVHASVQFISNFSRVYLLFKFVIWSIVRFFGVGLIVGSIASGAILPYIPRTWTLAALGIFVLWTAWKPISKRSIPDSGFIVVGFAVGLLGPMIGAIGPLIGPFMFRSDMPREQFVATTSVLQTLAHLSKFPVFFYIGFPFAEYWGLILVLSLVAILGSKIGVKLLQQTKEKWFRLMFRVVLLSSGIRLILLAF